MTYLLACEASPPWKPPKTIKLKGNTSTLWEKGRSFHYFILIQTNASHLCPHSLTALASHRSSFTAKPNTKGSLNNAGDAVLRFRGHRKWWPELSGWTLPTVHCFVQLWQGLKHTHPPSGCGPQITQQNRISGWVISHLLPLAVFYWKRADSLASLLSNSSFEKLEW